MKELKDSEIKTSPPKKPLIFYYLAALIVLMLLNVFLFPSLLERQVVEVPYSQFLTMVDGGQVEQVALDETSREIVFIAKDDGGREGYYKTGVWPDDGQRLLAQLQAEEGITFTAEIPTQANPILSVLVSWILPIVIFIVIGELLSRWMMKRMGGLPGGMGNAMTFGKSGAKVYVEEASTGVSFADVAGQDEAKESLKEVVDFLHDPEKYAAIGACLPKGVLLVGPPGTGKTLLAKAVAGEAKVPFFSISGSEFVEMFVGMGAAKVRDLFKQAREKAPCIVFIDEIDAIGKKRDSGGLGGNDEREQTLNQLLAEMDGFDCNKGVVILAATNRPESLDPALLRPGRFDRRVPVELPDLQGREAILKVHGRRVHIDGDVDLSTIARATAGASGAELANIVNEAALRAVRLGRKTVTQADLEESVETVIAGAPEEERGHPPDSGEADCRLPRGGPCPGGRPPVPLRPRYQDHHHPPHLRRPGVHHAGGRGGEMLMSRDRAGEQARHPHRRPGRRGTDLRPGQHDHRRLQRHRAGHQAGSGHDHPLRHDARSSTWWRWRRCRTSTWAATPPCPARLRRPPQSTARWWSWCARPTRRLSDCCGRTSPSSGSWPATSWRRRRSPARSSWSGSGHNRHISRPPRLWRGGRLCLGFSARTGPSKAFSGWAASSGAG